MNKKIKFCLLISLFLFLTGCIEELNNDFYIREQPHLYWKTVECKITKVDFYLGLFIHIDVTVYNEEYNLSKTFELHGIEGINFRHLGLEEGDSIYCKLYTQMYDSTGEIINRYLQEIVF